MNAKVGLVAIIVVANLCYFVSAPHAAFSPFRGDPNKLVGGSTPKSCQTIPSFGCALGADPAANGPIPCSNPGGLCTGISRCQAYTAQRCQTTSFFGNCSTEGTAGCPNDHYVCQGTLRCAPSGTTTKNPVCGTTWYCP